jgi:hypothetical protein
VRRRARVIYTIEERRARGFIFSVFAVLWHGIWFLTKFLFGLWLFLILFFFGVSCSVVV